MPGNRVAANEYCRPVRTIAAARTRWSAGMSPAGPDPPALLRPRS